MQGLDSSLIFLLLVGVVFYLMLYRPNKKRIDAHRALIESIDVDDEIVTIGGLFGTVKTITAEQFHVELAPGTTVRLAKSAVARRLDSDALSDSEAANDSESVEESQA